MAATRETPVAGAPRPMVGAASTVAAATTGPREAPPPPPPDPNSDKKAGKTSPWRHRRHRRAAILAHSDRPLDDPWEAPAMAEAPAADPVRANRANPPVRDPGARPPPPALPGV
jgi:hypothetical protein